VPYARTSLAQEIVAGENKMFARADSPNSRGVSYCVATFAAGASRSLNSGAQKENLDFLNSHPIVYRGCGFAAAEE
jgi:hypothetical protein